MLVRVVVLVLVVTCAPRLSAQEVEVLGGSPACARCDIELTPVATIRDSPPDVSFGDIVLIGTAAGGDYYVISPLDRARLHVFSSSGAYQRSIGRSGQGPGEYRYLAPPLIAPTGELELFDLALLRRTLLGSDGNVVSTEPLQARPSAYIYLADGTLVFNAVLPTVDRAGYPLHAIMRDGRLHSFGADVPQYRSDLAYLNLRRLTPGERDSFWAASIHEYRLELWTGDGSKLREIQRQVDWFKPWQGLAGGSPGDVRPNPEIHAIWLDGTQLWVMIRVPEQGWKPLPGGRRTAEGNARIVEGRERDLVWDTVIEVIDLESDQVLASKRFPQFALHVFNGKDILVYEEDDHDNPVFQLFRPALLRR